MILGKNSLKLNMTTILRLLSTCVILVSFSGCVEASKFFAGNALTDDPAVRIPDSLESVKLGVTTQEEVKQLLGTPTDRQQISENGVTKDSWSYGAADPVIQPYQYLPLIGVIAFLGDSEPQSFSVNFSEDGIVKGISWRTVQALGEEPYNLIRFPPGSDIPSYGTNNPMAPNPRYFPEPPPAN